MKFIIESLKFSRFREIIIRLTLMSRFCRFVSQSSFNASARLRDRRYLAYPNVWIHLNVIEVMRGYFLETTMRWVPQFSEYIRKIYD